jgi:hypothetical protein
MVNGKTFSNYENEIAKELRIQNNKKTKKQGDDKMSNEEKSQVKANPTHATLDAIDHEADLETQRQKRKDSSIIIDNPATEARKSGTDDGDKSEQDLSEEYPVEEMEALGNRKKSANQVRLPQ